MQAKKSASSKSTTKKTATKKVVAKKTTVKKTAVKKTTVKKTVATKKAATKKVAAKKTVAKKAPLVVQDPILDVIKKCCQAMDDKKAENLRVLDVRGKSPITNYFIIATATSSPHLRALANELEKTLKDMGIQAIGRDYNADSGWVVVDGFDFMAHIFLPDQRGLYGIESLWKDAEEISIL